MKLIDIEFGFVLLSVKTDDTKWGFLGYESDSDMTHYYIFGIPITIKK